MGTRKKLRIENAERRKEEKATEQLENNTKEFLEEIKEMKDICLEKLYNTLKNVISSSENADNVTAALSQNRVVLSEILLRQKNEETI